MTCLLTAKLLSDLPTVLKTAKNSKMFHFILGLSKNCWASFSGFVSEIKFVKLDVNLDTKPRLESKHCFGQTF